MLRVLMRSVFLILLISLLPRAGFPAVPGRIDCHALSRGTRLLRVVVSQSRRKAPEARLFWIDGTRVQTTAWRLGSSRSPSGEGLYQTITVPLGTPGARLVLYRKDLGTGRY